MDLYLIQIYSLKNKIINLFIELQQYYENVGVPGVYPFLQDCLRFCTKFNEIHIWFLFCVKQNKTAHIHAQLLVVVNILASLLEPVFKIIYYLVFL